MCIMGNTGPCDRVGVCGGAGPEDAALLPVVVMSCDMPCDCVTASACEEVLGKKLPRKLVK